MPRLLNAMPVDRANRLFLHPIHQTAVQDLVKLIIDLRQCDRYEDYFQFQQDLLEKVLQIQEHRAACTRILKRMQSGRGLPADVPELHSGENPNDADSWGLEADVCERVDRQFRSIGDAMAWRLFGYDRRVIVALSRNQPPGPMVGKDGLAAERDFLTSSWQDTHQFVLLHDLTNCLRIGDVTVFTGGVTEYEAYLGEIKTNPSRTERTQLQRMALAEEAIRSGGPLPGDPDGRLVQLNLSYKTHLSMLRDGLRLAADRGVIGMKVPGGRVLVVADMTRGFDLWSEEELLERTHTAHERALKRVGVSGLGQHVAFRSDDIVGRSPTQPPWANYPLDPIMCAKLIADMAVYLVTGSSEALVGALRSAGMRAEWLLPDEPTFEHGQAILRVYGAGRAIEMRAADLQRLLLELEQIPTWIATVEELLRQNSRGHPWPYYRNEWGVWA
jgi:hypothetical protein